MAITWNPSDKGPNVTLSNGNMTAEANSSNPDSVRATESKSSGKWYWEIHIDYNNMEGHCIGAATSADSITRRPGYGSTGYGYDSGMGDKGHDDFWDMFGDDYGTNDIIGVALDLDNGKIWFAKNNSWQDSGNPATGANPAYSGLSGAYFPMYSVREFPDPDPPDKGTVRFLASDQTYSPPSGFSAYETAASPTAVNLLDGKLKIEAKATATNLLDGKAVVQSSKVTWNPSDKSSYVTLLNSNMTAKANNEYNHGSVRATHSKTSGKWYWEVRIDFSIMMHAIGIGTSSALLSSPPGGDSYGYSYVTDGMDGSKYHGGSNEPFGNAYWTNDIIGIALDLDNNKLWFAKNNVWQEGGNPATGANPAYSGLSGIFFPMYCPEMEDEWGEFDQATARFLGIDQTYSPPSGFGAFQAADILASTSLLDGKLSINNPTDLLDGKARVTLSTQDLLDGKLSINSPVNLLDGKARIKDSVIDLLDGKARIKDSAIDLLDGKARIKDSAIDLLDGKLVLYLAQRQALLGGYVNFLGFFNILASLGETLNQLISLPIAQTEVQSFINQLSDYTANFQLIINQLTIGDPFTNKQDLQTSIQSEVGCQVLINELSDLNTKIQILISDLTESFTHRSSLIAELALKNDIQSVLTLVSSLSDQSALYPDCSINIYLNGVPINRQIINLSLTMDRETLFDTVSFNSIYPSLYLNIQDIVGSEDSVIEVQYKGNSWSFLVEELSGYELNFTVWGRSIAARSDTPFKDSSDYILETGTLASVLAAILVPDIAITWNAVDWEVPVGWSAKGTPVQMLQELAGSVGAIVRVFPDGTGLYIDERYTTRPIALPYASAVEYFDRDTNLISLSNNSIVGTKANAVTVYGYSLSDQYSITLEADNCVVVGNMAEIKVYPALSGVGYTLESSDGVPTYQYKKTSKQTETITFIGGKGSVHYPIVNLESIVWDGVIPSSFDYNIGQTEIVLADDTVAAIGEVTYFTSYDVWFAGHTGEGQLLVVYIPEEGSGIVARVYFGEGDREAEDLSRPALTSIEAVVAAGMAYLDNTSYTKLIRNINVPCSGVFDGDVVSIQSEPSGVTGNAFVARHEISARLVGDALKVYSIMDAVQFEV